MKKEERLYKIKYCNKTEQLHKHTYTAYNTHNSVMLNRIKLHSIMHIFTLVCLHALAALRLRALIPFIPSSFKSNTPSTHFHLFIYPFILLSYFSYTFKLLLIVLYAIMHKELKGLW